MSCMDGRERLIVLHCVHGNPDELSMCLDWKPRLSMLNFQAEHVNSIINSAARAEA